MVRLPPTRIRFPGALALLAAALVLPQGALGQALTIGDPALTAQVNEVLDLTDSTVFTLDVLGEPGGPVLAVVPVEGVPVTLDLEPHSVRSAEHYEVRVQLADGSFVFPDPSPVSTLRGTVVEVPGSQVAASYDDEMGLYARIIMPGTEEEYWVEQIANRIEGWPAGQHVAYRSSAIGDHDNGCGTDALPNPASPGLYQGFEGGAACGTGLCIAELGIDCDVQFYQDWGSNVSNVENRVNSVINAVNIQYESQVGIMHEITTIIVRTSEPDPYSSGTLGGLLDQMRDEWLTSGIPHDLAELFTGRNLSGGVIGVAWVSAVCTSLRYSVVENMNSLGCASDLSAHELGHNWGAGHCSCPGNTMNSGLTCANDFAQVSINAISNYRNSIGCLTAGCVAGPGLDCNNNGVADECDIGSGQSDDFNGNGLPDECEASIDLFVDAAAACSGTGGELDPFCELQTAIEAAKSGDMLILADGVYGGDGNTNLDLGGREITIRSANGPESCVLDASGGLLAGHFLFTSGETSDAVIQGLTLTGGHGKTNGGSIEIIGSSPTFIGCVIDGNSANISGGAVYVNGGSPTFLSCTVTNNEAGSFLPGVGGGLALNDANATIRNSTIADNEATSGFTPGAGGGVHVSDSSASVLTSNVVWGNIADGVPDSITVVGSDPTVTFSDIEGGFTGTGNMDVDPSFVGGGDYHLQSGSAVIDQGDSSAVGGGETDIDGDARIIGPDVDMGSDEFAAAICQPDLGFGGPGTAILSVCGDTLGTGGAAVVSLTGATPSVPAFFVMSLSSNPTPFGGGTLVPLPILAAIALATDASGEIVFPVPGGGGPVSLYIQYVIRPDLSSWELSNAVEMQFLP